MDLYPKQRHSEIQLLDAEGFIPYNYIEQINYNILGGINQYLTLFVELILNMYPV